MKQAVLQSHFRAVEAAAASSIIRDRMCFIDTPRLQVLQHHLLHQNPRVQVPKSVPATAFTPLWRYLCIFVLGCILYPNFPKRRAFGRTCFTSKLLFQPTRYPLLTPLFSAPNEESRGAAFQLCYNSQKEVFLWRSYSRLLPEQKK